MERLKIVKLFSTFAVTALSENYNHSTILPSPIAMLSIDIHNPAFFLQWWFIIKIKWSVISTWLLGIPCKGVCKLANKGKKSTPMLLKLNYKFNKIHAPFQFVYVVIVQGKVKVFFIFISLQL